MRLQYERPWQYGFIAILASPVSGAAVIRLDVSRHHDRCCHSYEAKTDCFNGRIYFNSYYLLDGLYRLDVSVLSWVGGDRTVETFSCDVEILNGPSSLAQSLRNEALRRPQDGLVLNALDTAYFSDYPSPLTERDFSRLAREGKNRRLLAEEQLSHFDEQGYLHLPAFFDPSVIVPARQALAEMNALEAHGFKRGSSMRFVNLHETLPALARIYGERKLYDAVSDLLGDQAYPCQSLTFVNGSGQPAHQDTIHLTPFPRGLMCGIWIALEDVIEGAGELFYYPRSHRLEAVLCRTHSIPKGDFETGDYGDYKAFGDAYNLAIAALLVENPDLERQVLMARAGDVLIWHENLLHGGCRRERQEATRMSMVIHAFAEGAYMMFDSSGSVGRRDWPFLDHPPGRPASTPVAGVA